MSTEPTGAICGGVQFEWRRVDMCPNEKRRRRIYGWTSSLWYEPTWTCLGCGDSWSGDYYLERPFRRGWRKDAIAQAKRDWSAARPLTKAQFRAAVREEFAA